MFENLLKTVEKLGKDSALEYFSPEDALYEKLMLEYSDELGGNDHEGVVKVMEERYPEISPAVWNHLRDVQSAKEAIEPKCKVLTYLTKHV